MHSLSSKGKSKHILFVFCTPTPSLHSLRAFLDYLSCRGDNRAGQQALATSWLLLCQQRVQSALRATPSTLQGQFFLPRSGNGP